MALVRLKDAVEDGSLMQEIGEPCHMCGIQQIDFEKDLVADIVTIEWHTFDQGDMSNIDGLSIIGVSAICSGKRVVNRGAKTPHVRVD